MTMLRHSPARIFAAPRHASGFTLIELVVSVVLSAIVIGFAALFMSTPVDAYFAQSRRSDLVDSSDAITRHLADDLRHALPKSVRIRNAGTRSIVELLLVQEVAFYRPNGSGGMAGPDTELKIGTADNKFAALGTFGFAPQVLPANYHLSVGNLGAGASNAYSLTNVITRNETIALAAGAPGSQEDLVTLTPAFRFTLASPSHRAFLISGPVTYICNSAANARTLRRYSGYAITAGIPTAETSAQLTTPATVNTIVARNVASCALRCNAGSTAPCLDALVVEMGVAATGNAANEVVRVFAQLPVENTP
jgi:MSHA biogenesis protein MshO